MRWPLIRCVLVALLLLVMPQSSFAVGSELLQNFRLPVRVATDAASMALNRCTDLGAAVTVSVVDSGGQLQVMLHGDGAAPHTTQLSRHKAYTAVSLAALQGFDTTSELADSMRRSGSGIDTLPLPADAIDGITPVSGGVVLRTDSGDLIGGIGVSGARSSKLDEQCALAARDLLDRGS